MIRAFSEQGDAPIARVHWDGALPTRLTIEKSALLVKSSFFLGLVFKGFYLKIESSRPGGIRTFSLSLP